MWTPTLSNFLISYTNFLIPSTPIFKSSIHFLPNTRGHKIQYYKHLQRMKILLKNMGPSIS